MTMNEQKYTFIEQIGIPNEYLYLKCVKFRLKKEFT